MGIDSDMFLIIYVMEKYMFLSICKESLHSDLLYFGIAWCDKHIAYGQNQLGVALTTLSKNIHTLGNKTKMFRFAYFTTSAFFAYNEIQVRESFQSTIAFFVTKKDEEGNFEVCGRMSSILAKYGEGKRKLMEISNEYGFSPQKIDYQCTERADQYMYMYAVKLNLR